MKKPTKFIPDTSKVIIDLYGCQHVECPKCTLFITNVSIDQIIKCPGKNCGYEFKVVG